MLQDGALGARTAALNEPYEGDGDNIGISIYTQDELNDIIAFHDKHHMQVAVHCIGDRAMDMVIEAIEKSPYRQENPKNRHGIVHAQITNQRIPGIYRKIPRIIPRDFFGKYEEKRYIGIHTAHFCRFRHGYR